MDKKVRKNKREIIKRFLKHKIPYRVKFGSSDTYDLMDFYEISTDYAGALHKFLKNKPNYDFYIHPLIYIKEYREIIIKIIAEETNDKEFYVLWDKYLQIMEDYLKSRDDYLNSISK